MHVQQTHIAIIAASVVAMGVGPTAAIAAQTPPMSSAAPTPDSGSQIPEKIKPVEPGTGGATQPQDQDLNENSNRDDGVIHPPSSVDSDMAVKPQDNGAEMQVIPPPGSPGGDMTVKPK